MIGHWVLIISYWQLDVRMRGFVRACCIIDRIIAYWAEDQFPDPKPHNILSESRITSQHFSISIYLFLTKYLTIIAKQSVSYTFPFTIIQRVWINHYYRFPYPFGQVLCYELDWFHRLKPSTMLSYKCLRVYVNFRVRINRVNVMCYLLNKTA